MLSVAASGATDFSAFRAIELTGPWMVNWIGASLPNNGFGVPWPTAVEAAAKNARPSHLIILPPKLSLLVAAPHGP